MIFSFNLIIQLVSKKQKLMQTYMDGLGVEARILIKMQHLFELCKLAEQKMTNMTAVINDLSEKILKLENQKTQSSEHVATEKTTNTEESNTTSEICEKTTEDAKVEEEERDLDLEQLGKLLDQLKAAFVKRETQQNKILLMPPTESRNDELIMVDLQDSCMEAKDITIQFKEVLDKIDKRVVQNQLEADVLESYGDLTEMDLMLKLYRRKTKIYDITKQLDEMTYCAKFLGEVVCNLWPMTKYQAYVGPSVQLAPLFKESPDIPRLNNGLFHLSACLASNAPSNYPCKAEWKR